MPASKSAIRTNINRIRGEEEGYVEIPEIKALLDEVLTEIPEEEENLQDIWLTLIEKADSNMIGDKLPGTVGRLHKIKYGKTKARAPKPKLRIRVTPAAREYLLGHMTTGPHNGSEAIYDGINKLIHPTALMRDQQVAVLSPYAFKKAVERSVRQFRDTKERAWARQIADGIIRRVEMAEAEGCDRDDAPGE
jgi:hypothetical protein